MLTGRVAIVTGAGRGLGRAHALALAERGAAVVVNDLGGAVTGAGADPGVADAVVEEVRAAGGRAVADITDVAGFDGAEALVRHALDAFGRLDVVVSNAGISRVVPLADLGEAELARFLGVHVVGTVGLTRAAFAVMERGGRVVVTTSGSGIAPGAPGLSAYATAKAAVIGFMRAAAIEGAPRGITVNAIAPLAYTRMSAGFFGAEREDELRPEHVARVVAWLASDEAGDVTGRLLRIEGQQVRELGWTSGADVDVGPLDIGDGDLDERIRSALLPRPDTDPHRGS